MLMVGLAKTLHEKQLTRVPVGNMTLFPGMIHFLRPLATSRHTVGSGLGKYAACPLHSIFREKRAVDFGFPFSVINL